MLRVDGGRPAAVSRSAANVQPFVPSPPSRKNAASSASRPMWVIARYHSPPRMVAGRSCSVMTSSHELTAMSSQASRNVSTLAAETTRLMLSRKTPVCSAIQRRE